MGLYFDRKRADRGYGYVGASRAKRRADVFLLGRVRRTDWLPVGVDARGGEQEYPSVLSETDSEEADSSDFADEDETDASSNDYQSDHQSEASSDDCQSDPGDEELDDNSASEYGEEALRGCDRDVDALFND